MGLFEKALETFDNMQQRYAGEYIADQQAPLAPIGFITTKSAIQVMINEKSEFLSAIKVEETVLIPATQKSSGRTNTSAPHPLFDNIGYLSGNDKEKYEAYLKQLKEWIEFDSENKLLLAVYDYVKKGELISDLEKYNCIDRKDDGKIKNEKDLIVWKFLDSKTGKYVDLWKNKEIMDSFGKYYIDKINHGEKNICMVSGKNESVTNQHLKGIFSLNGNAKLISANDSENFTYRGRFIDSSEACTVSYEASQKVHNALKWLISNQGIHLDKKDDDSKKESGIFGGRCFLCWNPKGREIPGLTAPLMKKTEKSPKISEYKDMLSKVVNGYKTELPEKENVIIASFDAATTGRLSISYYNELMASDYLDRLKFWDETCCWVTYDKKVYSPSLWQIVNTAFGTLREAKGKESFKADDKIVPQMMQTLLSCRVDMAKMPLNFMRALVCKSENLQLCNDIKIRNSLLFTTCAVIKKYRYDYFKEDCQMALEPQKKDRSYQYGRLLAVLEKAEKDTYAIGEERETNAIRMQSVFVNRPAYAAKILIEKVKTGYYPKLNGGLKLKYEKLIGEIMAVISEFPDNEYNKSLSETYLLGYYLQKNSLYAKKENDTENTEVKTEE